MIYLLSDQFWHPSRFKVVSDVCRSCTECQLRKISVKKFIPPTHKILTSFPFELCAIDLVALPRTRSNNIGCLVLADHKSKWVSAVPIKNKTSQHIASLLTNNIFPYLPKVPIKLLTDNGPEFSSAEFQENIESLNVKQIFTTPYNPTSNGLVERVNRTVNQMLSMLTSNPDRWDERLGQVLTTYNNTIHSELNISPSEFLLNHSHNCTNNPNVNILENSWRVGHPNFVPFKVGQKVIVKVVPRGNLVVNKLMPKYEGPYTVVSVNSNKVTYVVERQGITKRVHFRQLYLWTDPPQYLRNHYYFKDFLSSCENSFDAKENELSCTNHLGIYDSNGIGSIDSSYDSIDSIDSTDSSIDSSDSNDSCDEYTSDNTKSSISNSLKLPVTMTLLTSVKSTQTEMLFADYNKSNNVYDTSNIMDDMSLNTVFDQVHTTIQSLEEFVDTMYKTFNDESLL